MSMWTRGSTITSSTCCPLTSMRSASAPTSTKNAAENFSSARSGTSTGRKAPPTAGISIPASGAPDAGIEIPAVGGALRPVEVPDRAEEKFSAAFFVEVGAEAERIDVKGQHVEDVMVDPRVHIDIRPVTVRRVRVVRAAERRVERVHIILQILLLGRALWKDDVLLFRVHVADELADREKTAVTGIEAVDLHHVT